MSTKNERMQRFIRYWKEQTGETVVDMHRVAQAAYEQGWSLPKRPDLVDLLAKEFKRAARAEIRHDTETGELYRGYHAIPYTRENGQLTFAWIDIEEAKRSQMWKALSLRREGMVNDGLQLTLDAEHWTRVHPDEEPIQLEMDITPDIEWRRNAPKEDEAG